MRNRTRSKSKSSHKSLTYNFIYPLDDAGAFPGSPFKFGPYLYESDGTKIEEAFAIEIPTAEQEAIEGMRSISNIDIQLQVLFFQLDDQTGKYTPIFPFGVQMVTAIIRDGQFPLDLVYGTYDSKWSRQHNLDGSTKQFTICKAVGPCAKPQQQIIDIRPVLITSTGTDNSVTQHINRIIINDNLDLEKKDRICVFFVIPSQSLLFYSNDAKYYNDVFCVGVNGTITYQINF